MGSQSNIAQTSFLEDCICKKRTCQDIYEALGLYSEISDTRKEPVFHKDEANTLHKKIREIAVSYRATYRNNEENMLADLIKDGAFADDCQRLSNLYGQVLWTRNESWPTRYSAQQGSIPDELNWEKEADRESIRFYIRCWITRYAVQVQLPRKGKARASIVVHELSGGEVSDTEDPRIPSPWKGALPSDLPFCASEARGQHPSDDAPRTEVPTVQARLGDSKSVNGFFPAGKRSPTTPNKRKSLSFQGQQASGKLQKVLKEARATAGPPRVRLRDVHSGFRLITPLVQAHLVGIELPDQEENMGETDRTWEPSRAETAETETVIDPDEVMTGTQEMLLDTRIASDQEEFRAYRSPTAGPSGTYRNPQRQDSVIPPSTQYSASNPISDQYSARKSDKRLWQGSLLQTTQLDVSELEIWQQKQLRVELFKLLLSHLNGINQFYAETYEPESEDRMNSLLYQLWINDVGTVRSRVGGRFDSLQNALENWMNMRYMLTQFQRTTGYFGRPGEQWREHLRRMDCVPHAKASIAFVDLKTSAGMSGAVLCGGSSFASDLATVFDLLTQVEGCNGEEEFGALHAYNEELLEWFP